ncbi:hypothetical protein AB0M10_15200 [Streptomyces sp. NPDC051840]|uniref:hypothetical protein n=1 Tax=Streptomyces sp. NPDC051840 TaxID=3154752 RepID=UPI0034499450
MSALSGMSAEGRNETRAEWALDALRAFGKNTGQDYFDEPLQPGDLDLVDEAGGDLVCALMHLFRKLGGNAEELLERGRGHFEHGVGEEASEQAEMEETANE